MTQRYSLYREVHKGLRVMLFDLVRKSGRIDFTDPCAVATFRSELAAAIELLASHAHHENEFIGPAIAAHAPALAEMIATTHDDQDAELDALLARLDAIDPASPRAAADGQAFLVRLSRAAGELLVHMAEEEEQIMPALWAAMEDPAIVEIGRRLVAAIAPDKMARFLTWMLPAMNADERVAMLSGMRATAPPQVFRFVRDLARNVLDSSEDAALERALEGSTLQPA